MIASKPTTATPSQYASAAIHLERRAEWRTVRIDGERYVSLTSGQSNRVYLARADAAGCSCIWNQQTGTTCSHMLAICLAALEDELRETMPAPRTTYADLFPPCRACGDLTDAADRLCDRCATDREWEARRAAVGVR
jgi:hypothetical protein